jgi:hypothetical protein
LATNGRLHGELQIPNTAGTLEIVADLAARQITVATNLDAPREGQSRGRIGWLLRQLQKAPNDLTIETRVPYAGVTRAAQLSAVRDNPGLLLPEKGKEIRSFRLTFARDIGLNRAGGRGSFIESVVGSTKSFYRDVLQNLAAWKPRAPQLPPSEAEPPTPTEQELDELAETGQVEPDPNPPA